MESEIDFETWFGDRLKRDQLNDEQFAIKARGLGFKLSKSAPRWWRTGAGGS